MPQMAHDPSTPNTADQPPADGPLLILASRSPRRASLLTAYGYSFIVIASPFDDPASPPDDHPDCPALAAKLARRKAAALAGDAVIQGLKKVGPQTADQPLVILGADTICVDPTGRLAGTPTSRAEAESMIQGMLNADHQVITGVVLLPCDCAGQPTDDPHVFADSAMVHVGGVEQRDIDAYLATDQWQGKAGGYNLFDRQADGWPITVTGDPTTVVGLPMQQTTAALARMRIIATTTATRP